MVHMYEDYGWPIKRIARHFRCGTYSVLGALLRAGVKTRRSTAPYTPTMEEIAKATEEIQAGWTKEERRRRERGHRMPFFLQQFRVVDRREGAYAPTQL